MNVVAPAFLGRTLRRIGTEPVCFGDRILKPKLNLPSQAGQFNSFRRSNGGRECFKAPSVLLVSKRGTDGHFGWERHVHRWSFYAGRPAFSRTAIKMALSESQTAGV